MTWTNGETTRQNAAAGDKTSKAARILGKRRRWALRHRETNPPSPADIAGMMLTKVYKVTIIVSPLGLFQTSSNSPFVADTAFRVARFQGPWERSMPDFVLMLPGDPFIVSRRLVKSLVYRRFARFVSLSRGRERPTLVGQPPWLCGQTLFEKLFHTVRKKEERIDAA